MKRRITAFSTVFLFLFCSCADVTEDAATLTARLGQINTAKYTAEITADFPTREQSFTLGYTYERGKDARVSVIRPTEVAGVSFIVSGDATSLEFDGARLATGRLSENGLSPFTALPCLISSWERLDTAESCRISGREALLAICCDENGTETRTWFSEDEILPLYAEIFLNGERVIQCHFEGAEHNTNENT